ncbi:MAG: FtsX-like permease family protein [Deltaproteobacteria bacterium]|nr:FtsX-like permease family protein [Deltaproteobacteria bacterium]MBW2068447.1 FtsX-like permease family protein [Deltaproteobacteria bacterium]
MRQVENDEVRKQIVLPWKQVFVISWIFVKARWSRCLITTLSLVLAIAFFSYTQMTFDILNSLWPMADEKLRRAILMAGYEAMERGDGRVVFGVAPKDIWLLSLALLVCLVGITNAQLMAVTERFREIGTMKCLGALDNFIVRIFFFETLYQGVVGSIVGGLLGILLAFLSLVFKFGFVIIQAFPIMAVFKNLGISLSLALLLSFVGVAYPCQVASRMEAAEALRYEL